MSHINKVIDADPHFVIDINTRNIKNVSQTKTSLVQYDHNSERFSFTLPRFVEGHDMTECNSVQVHYFSSANPDTKGLYEIDDLSICEEDTENVCCTWLISRNVTQTAGALQFILRFACLTDDGTEEYAWHTNPFRGISISAGMNNAEAVAEQYADILEQWKTQLFDASAEGVENINTAKTAAVAEIEAAGQRVADSLPDDYTAMSAKVDVLENEKISKDILATQCEVIERVRIKNSLPGNAIAPSTASATFLKKFDMTTSSGLIYTLLPYEKVYTSAYALICVTNADEVSLYGREPIENYSDDVTTITGRIVTVDIDAIKAKYPTAKYLYIGMEYATAVDLYTTDVSHIKWMNGATDRILSRESEKPLQNKVIANMVLPTMQVPAESVAVVGHEWNMYFDNIFPDFDTHGLFVKVSGISAELNERYLRITPTTEDVGDYTLDIQLCKRSNRSYDIVARQTMTLHIIQDESVGNKNILFIGDSLTNSAIYPAEIQHNLSHGEWSSVGTKEKTVSVNGDSLTVKHEGRNGWCVTDYVNPDTVSKYKDDTNPFINPNTNKFDFSYYLSNNNIVMPDVVCLNLGTNDTNNYRQLENTISAMNEMIASIHSVNANIIILIPLISNCAYHTSFNFLVRAGMVRDVYMQNYSARTDNVFLSDLYIGIDTVNDFPKTMTATSARNNTQIEVYSDAIHPNESGYLHFADCYYNHILYRLSTQE